MKKLPKGNLKYEAKLIKTIGKGEYKKEITKTGFVEVPVLLFKGAEDIMKAQATQLLESRNKGFKVDSDTLNQVVKFSFE